MSNQAVSKTREMFLSIRMKEEQKIAELAKNLSSIDIKEVYGDLEIPANLSLQTLCPEIYKEFPDATIYKQQFDDMYSLFAKMNECTAKYRREASECLQKFATMQ